MRERTWGHRCGLIRVAELRHWFVLEQDRLSLAFWCFVIWSRLFYTKGIMVFQPNHRKGGVSVWELSTLGRFVRDIKSTEMIKVLVRSLPMAKFSFVTRDQQNPAFFQILSFNIESGDHLL